MASVAGQSAQRATEQEAAQSSCREPNPLGFADPSPALVWHVTSVPTVMGANGGNGAFSN